MSEGYDPESDAGYDQGGGYDASDASTADTGGPSETRPGGHLAIRVHALPPPDRP